MKLMKKFYSNFFKTKGFLNKEGLIMLEINKEQANRGQVKGGQVNEEQERNEKFSRLDFSRLDFFKFKKSKGLESLRDFKKVKKEKGLKNLKKLKKGISTGINIGRNLCYRSVSDTQSFLNKKVNLPESSIPSLASVLPYRYFDERQGLYFNEKSIGFLLEANPLIGADQTTSAILTGMITDGVPAGCTIQIINLASPRIGSTLNTWINARSQTGGIYAKLAERRFKYYSKSNWESLFTHPNCILRNFRLFIAVSIPSGYGLKGEIRLRSIKLQLKSTLSTIGLFPIDVYPDQFLSIMDELLNPTRTLNSSKIKSDNLNPLNVQLKNGETTIEINPYQLVFETRFFAPDFSEPSVFEPMSKERDEVKVKVIDKIRKTEKAKGEEGVRRAKEEEKKEEEEEKKEDKGKGERTAVRCLSVNRFPEAWSQWQMSDLIGDKESDYLTIPCPFLQMSSFTFLDELKSSGKARSKCMRATQQAGTDLARYIPDLGERARDWRFVVDKLNQGQKLVKAHFEVVLYAKEEEIEGAEQAARSLYRSKGWELISEKYVQFQSWLMSLPFMPSEGLFDDLDKLKRTKTMITWTVANIAPLQGEWKGMNSPLILLIGKRGQPFFWDPYMNDQGNFNVAIAGKMGSGKSVFLQEIITSSRALDGQVIVIEDGYSSRNSCLMQGGTYVAFSGQNIISLNPFSIISEEAFLPSKPSSSSIISEEAFLLSKPSSSSILSEEAFLPSKSSSSKRDQGEETREYRTEVICFISDLIRRMCKASDKTTDVENSYIDEAVIYVLDTKGRNGEITDVANYLVAQADPRAMDLGRMLSSYIRGGRYGHFFEGQSEICLDQDLITFEFSELKEMEDLSEIVLILLMFLVAEKMYRGKRKRRITLIIDEAWSLLKGESSGKFIEGVVRRARKYKGSIITAVQDIDSYFKTAVGEAAWSCADWRVILGQNNDVIEGLKKRPEKIVIDEEKERALKSLKMLSGKYSEVLIEGPYGWAVGRLILDPFSVALYSSKAEDFERIQSLQEQGLSIEDAIEHVAQEISKGRRN